MTSILKELENEAEITGRVLERVPEDKLTWKPHPKSMTLGQLALHAAGIPGAIPGILANDTFDVDPKQFGNAPQPESKAQVLETLEKSVATGKQFLAGLTPQQAEAIWRLNAGGREIMALPREWVIRSVMLNHWYHHRGQLSVYLRLLDIPVPMIYGASADENPFQD